MARLSLPNLPLSVVVVSWAFNFVALKELYAEMTAPAVALVRFVLMFTILAMIMVFRGISFRYPKEHAARIHLAGFVSMGVYMVFFLEGMKRTTAPEGAIVLATAPVFTYLLACLFGQERFVRLALVGALVAFAGVALVVGGGGEGAQHGTVFGNLLILVSSLVWAASVVILRPALGDVKPLRSLTLSMPAALLVLIPYGGPSVAGTDFGQITPYAWLMLGHMVVFAGVVAFACFYEGIRQIGASRATLYQYFVPPVTALFSLFVTGERLTLEQGAGLLVVIAGVALAGRAREKAARQAT